MTSIYVTATTSAYKDLQEMTQTYFTATSTCDITFPKSQNHAVQTSNS